MVGRRRWSGALWLLVGCASAPGPTRPVSSSRAVPAAPPVARPAPQVELPDFAKLDVDLGAAYASRATMRRFGDLYEGHDGPVLAPGGPGEQDRQLHVIDPDRDGTPRRPRVLCVEPRFRVAVFVDEGSLQTTVSAAALVMTSPDAAPAPPASDDTTPGIRLAAGAPVELVDTAASGARRVRYRGTYLSGEGWVDPSLVDVTFVPAALADDGMRDARLVKPVALRVQPRGGTFAQIVAERSWDLHVRKLGGQRRGFQLVRFHDERAAVVGWIPRSALESFPEENLAALEDRLGGAAGEIDAGTPVAAPRGTLLASPATGAILGVVTQDTELYCAGACGDARLVSVSACGAEIELRLRAPAAN
jgi:hypothetical protein